MKNIKALIGGLALAAIVGVNGYMAIGSGISTSELSIVDVENVAEGENPWYLWILYGYTADEYHRDWSCTVNTNGGLSYILELGGGCSYPGHERVCYDGGNENCSSFSCTKDSELSKKGIWY